MRAAQYGLKGEVTENVTQAIARARELDMDTEGGMTFIGGNIFVMSQTRWETE